MMKKIMTAQLLILLCLSFSPYQSSYAKKIKSFSDVKRIVKKVKKKNLMKDLRSFVSSSGPNRLIGTPGHKQAKEFLISEIKKLNNGKVGQEVRIDSFVPEMNMAKSIFQSDFDKKVKKNYTKESKEYKKWNSFKNYMFSFLKMKEKVFGHNIIWSKDGESKKKIILTAHYDTISHDKKTLKINEKAKMPGADYNASGVIIALNLIELLSKLELKHSVEIVFLDYQGVGFLGSYDYAQKIKKDKDKDKDEDIVGVVNLEMLGHDSKFFDKLKKFKNMAVYTRSNEVDSKRDMQIVSLFERLNKKTHTGIKFSVRKNDFVQSDHFRFWDAGLPAVTYSQDWENDFNSKRYQNSNDFPETINQNTYFRVFQYIAYGTLGFLAGF